MISFSFCFIFFRNGIMFDRINNIFLIKYCLNDRVFIFNNGKYNIFLSSISPNNVSVLFKILNTEFLSLSKMFKSS